MTGMHVSAAASDVLAMTSSAVAGLTIGISVYAAIILITVGLGISAARRGRRRAAWIYASVVGVLTVAGVVIAVASSVA